VRILDRLLRRARRFVFIRVLVHYLICFCPSNGMSVRILKRHDGIAFHFGGPTTIPNCGYLCGVHVRSDYDCARGTAVTRMPRTGWVGSGERVGRAGRSSVFTFITLTFFPSASSLFLLSWKRSSFLLRLLFDTSIPFPR